MKSIIYRKTSSPFPNCVKLLRLYRGENTPDAPRHKVTPVRDRQSLPPKNQIKSRATKLASTSNFIQLDLALTGRKNCSAKLLFTVVNVHAVRKKRNMVLSQIDTTNSLAKHAIWCYILTKSATVVLPRARNEAGRQARSRKAYPPELVLPDPDTNPLAIRAVSSQNKHLSSNLKQETTSWSWKGTPCRRRVL